MSETKTYPLERLYYGVLVDSDRPVSQQPEVIARTPGVTPAQIAECLRVGKLQPPPLHEATPGMPGALALLQSRTTHFVLAKAQYSDAGFPQVMYVLVPVEVARQLGGNVLTFRTLGLAPMPAFSSAQAALPPFELRAPQPPTREEQLGALLDLLGFCQDSLQTVEGILAGLVQGWPLAIANSPRSLTDRLQFVQGLLSLLPVPARTGITFATHVTDLGATLAQIKFTSQSATPSRHLVYDWERGALLTHPPEDAYSRYIVAQLRLDPSLVVDQTEALGRTTLWRAAQRERLGPVLAWVARRAAVDRIVLDGQPADRALVASILREDPTLSGEMRLVYVRHVLAFALALREPESADVIPVVTSTHPVIAAAVASQLRAAIDQGHAALVVAMLTRWLLNVPEAAALKWTAILHDAAEKHLGALLGQNNLAPACEFLAGIRHAHPALQLDRALPRLIRIAQPVARRHSRLAYTLVALGADLLPAAPFQQLLRDRELTAHFPADFHVALDALSGEARTHALPGTLERAGRAFGGEDRLVMVARLAEWAAYVHRTDLIDPPCLNALMALARSPRGANPAVIEHITRDFTDLVPFLNLEPPGHRTLIELLLQSRQFDRALALLERSQNELYGAERLGEFTRLAGDVVQSVSLSAGDLVAALERLEGSRLRSEPRAAMLHGALRSHQWGEGLDYAAQRLTTMVFNQPVLIRVIGPDQAIKLLSYHARAENGLSALRAAAALTQATIGQGAVGVAQIAEMWQAITWNASMTQAALELLRRYVRGIPRADVPRVLRYLEREIGLEPARELHATHLMRNASGDQPLPDFIEAVEIAAALLSDLAATYHAGKVHPPLHRLRRDFDQMTGNLSEAERQRMSDSTLRLAQQVYDMGQKRSRRAGRQPAEQALVEGAIMPQSGVDLLRFIGGHLARRTALPIVLQREEMAHLFGSRSAAMLLREIATTIRLLDHLQAAFRQPTDPVTPGALQAELDSLWNTLSLYDQRRLRDDFACACQQLAHVISLMFDETGDRALGSSGISRQLDAGQRQPHTALEALRWMSGYFGRKHQRS
ncbi:MAG TPA: hypothetical protein PKD46_12360 [Aggregatilineaceae bacterium]|nr:hypothetical protein [Aggregatilineaceae bacterium]